MTNSTVAQTSLGQSSGELELATNGRGFTDLTPRITGWLESVGAVEGLLTAFVRHTSASLTIQENADPDVRHDLAMALDTLAPESAPYIHTYEGPDDMPAHIKTMLTDVSLAIPVLAGRLRLGTWQSVYLVEHRAAPHSRSVALHYIGTFDPPRT